MADGHENDPPKRVIGLALASILFLRCLSWSFQVWEGSRCVALSLGTYDAATGRAATGRTAGRATAGAAAAAGTAATVAIVPTIVVAVMVAVMVAILIVILVFVAVVAQAEPGPRMTFVLAGKGRG